MDKQNVFNFVRAHLLQQNAKSEVLGQLEKNECSCRYRLEVNNRTLKCAIGAMIPDELYEPEMDMPEFGVGVVSLLDRFPEVRHHLGEPTEEDVMFLDSLQDIHDFYKVEAWPQVLKDLANNYGLQY